jgi:hypothetical protein
MSKKLLLDKSTLSRLQANQLNAVIGGADGYESKKIGVEVDELSANAGTPDSCCSKSCNNNPEQA